MIDADEAEARTHRAADEQARREAERHARRQADAQARRDAEEHARREAEDAVAHSAVQTQVETAAERTATEKDASAPQSVAEGDPGEVTEDLPVFAWLKGVESAPPTVSDWTRDVVRAKEARADDPGPS